MPPGTTILGRLLACPPPVDVHHAVDGQGLFRHLPGPPGGYHMAHHHANVPPGRKSRRTGPPGQSVFYSLTLPLAPRCTALFASRNKRTRAGSKFTFNSPVLKAESSLPPMWLSPSLPRPGLSCLRSKRRCSRLAACQQLAQHSTTASKPEASATSPFQSE